jgi:hypothetical protein
LGIPTLEDKILQRAVEVQWKGLCPRMRGHYQFYGITGNIKSLSRYRYEVGRRWWRSLNRRSGHDAKAWNWFKVFECTRCGAGHRRRPPDGLMSLALFWGTLVLACSVALHVWGIMTQKLKWIRHADLAIRKTPTVGRGEYLDHMTFQANRRPLFTEIFGPIVGLKEEWEEQGAVPAELDFSAFRYRCEARGYVPVNTGRCGGYPEELLEETEEHRIWRDGLGRTMKWPKGTATLALPLDHPVKTMDDWLKIKPWYEFSEVRFEPDWEVAARRMRAEDRAVAIAMPGGFDEPRQLLGEEMLCLAYYEQPELVHDMLETMGATARAVVERVSAAVAVDLLFVHEDMAGKSGPLAGPVQVRDLIVPYYRRVWEVLQDRGARVFDQDSDGNMNPVLDAFLDAGVNCMHPMEPAAGMDVVQVRARCGTRLAFYGGIDKPVLRRSRDEIVAELEYKIPPMVRTGGCVIALDHRVPNGTPLENYRYYVAKAWEIMEREAS